MALVNVPPFIYGNVPNVRLGGLSSAANLQLNADTEYLFFHFIAPATETIDKVEFRASTVTTGGNAEVSICTVAADGSPDTLVGSEIAVNVASATWYEATGLNAALTAGTLYGVRIMVAASVDIAFQYNWGGSETHAAPGNIIAYNTGSLTRVGASGRGVPISIGTASGYRYVSNLWHGPVSTTTTNINSTGTDFVGNKMVIPFKCKIGGIHALHSGSFVPDLSYLITNAAGTILASRDNTAAQSGPSSGGVSAGHSMFDADVAQYLTVNAGDTIYVLVQATSAVNTGIYQLDFRVNASLGAMWGTTSFGVSGTVLGTFTEHDTRLYQVFPIITALDDGVGAGGGLAANPIKGFLA